MSSFFSGLLTAPGGQGGRGRSALSSRSPKATPNPSPSRSQDADPSVAAYIYDESQLQPLAPVPGGLQGLNNDLAVLATVFPDVQVEVFREMLHSFSEESRRAVVADAMLKEPVKWVKGRRRPIEAKDTGRETTEEDMVPRAETFRGAEYKSAVRALALHEFKGLSKDKIDAALSETNFSYFDARPTLVQLSQSTWRYQFSSLFFRRKAVTTTEAATHPLIIWRSSGLGSIAPSIKSTGNAELDRELFQELVLPLQRQEREDRQTKDRELAMALHTEEAEACGATHECACCFVDSTFEEFTTCSTDGHMICFRCVQHSIQEAVFGQGWQRTINKDTGTLRCPAATGNDCSGCITSDHIHRAMQEEKRGAEILHKFDQRLAEDSLISSGLPLVRCPCCNYAEVDEIYIPNRSKLRFRASNIPNLIAFLIFLGCVPVLWPGLVLLLVLILLFVSSPAFRSYTDHLFSASVCRYQRRRLGPKFTCQNPDCGRSSCMICSKPWVDIHICHESSLVALRSQVEQAMSLAIKRVCPRCNMAFVKQDGCNKMKCPCGYLMCYVCRKDISPKTEGYAHFCQHFRPEGDGSPCKECDKCNLWEKENAEAVLKQARQEAEKKWMENENRSLTHAETKFIESGGSSVAKDDLFAKLSRGKLPSVDDLADFVVVSLFI